MATVEYEHYHDCDLPKMYHFVEKTRTKRTWYGRKVTETYLAKQAKEDIERATWHCPECRSVWDWSNWLSDDEEYRGYWLCSKRTSETRTKEV